LFFVRPDDRLTKRTVVPMVNAINVKDQRIYFSGHKTHNDNTCPRCGRTLSCLGACANRMCTKFTGQRVITDKRLLSLDRETRMAAQPQRRPLRVAKNTIAIAWTNRRSKCTA
jgi:hypothetical protein